MSEFYYSDVSIDKVVKHPELKDLDRTDTGDLDPLVQSIKEIDLSEDIILQESGKKGVYYRIQGLRRITAAKKAGKKIVHAKIYRKDLPRHRLFELADSSDDYRKERTAFERGRFYDAWLKCPGVTEVAIAKKKGVTQSDISKFVTPYRKLAHYADEYECIHTLSINRLSELSKYTGMSSVLEPILEMLSGSPKISDKDFQAIIGHLKDLSKHKVDPTQYKPLIPRIGKSPPPLKPCPIPDNSWRHELMTRTSAKPVEKTSGEKSNKTPFDCRVLSLINEARNLLNSGELDKSKCEKCEKNCSGVLHEMKHDFKRENKATLDKELLMDLNRRVARCFKS